MTSTLGKVPISSHPAFKWVVGAWFAGLLGLGLFVMPRAIHDLLSTNTGLAGLGPFAEPPVSFAGRALLAAIAALLGLLLGLVIAQRVALANALDDEDEIYFTEEPESPVAELAERPVWLGDTLASQPAHRVFNPREEIGEEGIAGPPPVYPWPEDPEDELIEDARIDEGGEDALMQAWREENGLPEEYLPEIAPEEALVSPFEHGEDEEEPETEAPATLVEAVPVQTGEWDDVEAEATISDTEPESGQASELSPRAEAFGDMSLAALTARLRQSLAAAQARDTEAATLPVLPVELDEPDAVIAFLRREAGRHAPETNSASRYDDDPQAVLRSALDKLSRVSNPK